MNLIFSFLSRHKFYVVFTAIVFAGISFALIISAGFYPIAFVNGKFVTARRFVLEYAAADSYYRRILETYGNKVLGGEEVKPADLEASAMEKIIEDILVKDGARREVGSDLDNLVQNKLSQLSSDQLLQEGASDLYGLNKNDFWDFILIPQAQRDILAGRLFLKGKKIGDWLAGAKKSAKVIILSNEFRWSGDKIEVK